MDLNFRMNIYIYIYIFYYLSANLKVLTTQYVPYAGDSVLGIVVDSKADVRNFACLHH